jgi:hypothetical protein
MTSSRLQRQVNALLRRLPTAAGWAPLFASLMASESERAEQQNSPARSIANNTSSQKVTIFERGVAASAEDLPRCRNICHRCS